MSVSVAPALAPARSAVRPALPRFTSLVTPAAVVVGCLFRLLAITSDRPLWIDEAMLALNVEARSWAELAGPLDSNQTAPLGFLLLTKLSVTTFGAAPWAFRLVPLLGSLLGLFAFPFAAREWLSPAAARLAVCVFAVSPAVVSYAAEAKQYSTDTAVAVALLAGASPLLRGRSERGPFLAVLVGGAVAVWLSHPAVFVLGGLVVAMLTRGDRGRAATCAAVWGASFAALCWVQLRHSLGGGYLTDYWADYFLPRSAAAVPWVVERGVDFFGTAGGFGGSLLQADGLAAVLAGVGGIAMWSDGRRAETTWVGAMLILVLAASAARAYPFCGRLLLFLAPVAVLLVARGATTVADRLSEWSAAAGGLFLGVVVVAPLAAAVSQVKNPPRAEDLPQALAFVAEWWQPGDVVYMYNGRGDAGTGPAFRFYHRNSAIPSDAIVLGGEHRGEPLRYRDEVRALPPAARVWLLVSHPHQDEVTLLRAYLDEAGDRGREFAGRGAAVYEYTRRPDNSGR